MRSIPLCALARDSEFPLIQNKLEAKMRGPRWAAVGTLEPVAAIWRAERAKCQSLFQPADL
jgi:hypothetical protein